MLGTIYSLSVSQSDPRDGLRGRGYLLASRSVRLGSRRLRDKLDTLLNVVLETGQAWLEQLLLLVAEVAERVLGIDDSFLLCKVSIDAKWISVDLRQAQWERRRKYSQSPWPRRHHLEHHQGERKMAPRCRSRRAAP